jgi:hypothetical protein
LESKKITEREGGLSTIQIPNLSNRSLEILLGHSEGRYASRIHDSKVHRFRYDPKQTEE